MNEDSMPRCAYGCREHDPTVRIRQEECDSCGRPQIGPALCDACAVKHGKTKLASDLRPWDRV